MIKTIKSENDKYDLFDVINDMNLPITVTIKDGVCRSTQQNKLQGLWFREAAQQLRDENAEGYRAYCKLHFGIPIKRANDDYFRDKYDETIRHLSYEQKIECMKSPIDLPVTRDMNTKEMTEYMDAIYQHLTGLGVKLTEPGEV